MNFVPQPYSFDSHFHFDSNGRWHITWVLLVGEIWILEVETPIVVKKPQRKFQKQLMDWFITSALLIQSKVKL